MSGPDFNAFLTAPQEAWPFIGDNAELMHQWNGVDCCLLVLAEGRTDGVLVNSDGSDRALCAAYLPRARAIVDAELDRVADYIISRNSHQTAGENWRVCPEELEERFSVVVQAGNGLDIMLKEKLERRPEVARVEMTDNVIETVVHPKFRSGRCGSAPEKRLDIRLRDVLPLLKGGGLAFLTHEAADTSVLAEHMQRLTDAGREEHAALLDARVSEISPGPEGTEVVLTDVAPEELARFNWALEAFETAEQAMGPVMQEAAMEQKINLSRAAGELTSYAAQRLVGYEQNHLGDSCRRPEVRHEWIRDALRGMAEVCGQDAAPILHAFDQRMEAVRWAFSVEVLPLDGQRHMIQSLRKYASALERMEGDQRARILHTRELLGEVCAYLPWNPDVNGARAAYEQVSDLLQQAVARCPIRFTRVLLGGDLDPGGVEFMPGLVDDSEGVRRTREFQRLTLEYPKRDEWPALCTVYLGGQPMAWGAIDADGIDMMVIREAGDRFLKRPGVSPVGYKQLCVPVHEQIRVLKVEPGRLPEEITMPNTLEAFQAAVGGDIEALGLDSGTVLICNEEGKLMGLPANRQVGGDTIAGTFLIAGSADGEFCSLTDEDAAHYAREFAQPVPSYGDPGEPTKWEFHVL